MPDSQASAAAPAREPTPAQEYRICVCDSPTELADEVTDLLSQGWELHGHPFVDLQFSANGHGKQLSGNRFCQAMVRGVSGTAVVSPLAERTSRPRVAPTVRNVAIFLALLFGACFFGDAILFRSGIYVRFLEPESMAGSLELTYNIEKAHTPNGKKEVLVVGSSRMAEGFSAKQANEYKPEDGVVFYNAAIPSAGARSFYYLIRDLDPNRNRYAAITLPIDDYDDSDDIDDPNNRLSDLHLVINRLRMLDIIPFTMSFRTWKTRFEAFRGSLFKGTVYQLDVVDFLEHPAERVNRVKMFRKSGADWAYDYAGINHNLGGMNIDLANRKITFPPNMDANYQKFFENLFFGKKAPQHGWMREFEVRWLGALADLYRGSKTKLVIFQAPRGPGHGPNPKLPWVSVDELRKRPEVTVIDQNRFTSLERPELFADHVHLSADGRKVFTPMFADAVKEIVH